MTPEEMHDRLSELGIESEFVSYPNKKTIGVKWQTGGIVWKYDWYGCTPQALSTYMHYSPKQAIAATVGGGMTLDEATEYAERFMGDYAKVLLASTLYAERDEPTDRHAFDVAEQKEAQMARDLAEALATMGVGTCKFNVVIDNDPSPRHRGNICECNKCGYRCARGFIVDERFKCCPNCGRRIIEEVTE